MKLLHPLLYLPIPRRNALRRLAARAPEPDFLSPFERQRRCIFFHIPKTGGIAISESVLDGFHTNHRIYRRCMLADPVSVARYWKFCILRDPIDRFVSAYRFLSAGGINAQDRAFRDSHAGAFSDFETFLAAFEKSETMRSYVHFRPQAAFVCDASGAMRMDFAGRFENLPAAFGRISEKLGVSAQLRHLNRTPDDAGRPEMPAGAADFLREIYRADYDLLASIS